MEGDLEREYYASVISTVSIHALAWRATRGVRKNLSGGGCFNPRPRVEGDRPFAGGQAAGHMMFQSTPSRGGRPVPVANMSVATNVSIHALAWRATPPLRGGVLLHNGFNPRPRVEGDPGHRYKLCTP